MGYDNDLHLRVDNLVFKAIQHNAEKRGISISKMVRKIIIENFDKYADLSDIERQFMQVRKKELKDKMQFAINAYKIKTATWISYLHKMVKELKLNGADKDEILDILESCTPVAERRDKMSELNELIEYVKRNEIKPEELGKLK